MFSNTQTKSAFVATGLMLFALFFGAGNLIFPAYMGQQAGENIFTAMLGFLMTGAGLPLLGVVAVAYSNSRDLQQMATPVSKWYAIIFTVSLYLAIGPLFAAPRTATVSFEIGIVPFLGENIDENVKSTALRIFCLFFFGCAYWLSISPGKLVDRIGKILTPVLLFTIAVLVGTAAVHPMGALQASSEAYTNGMAFTKGILEGYSTMDALASLVFAIIVIDTIRRMGVTEHKSVLSLTVFAGLVAASCLAVVYVFIGYMGATSVVGIGLQETGAAILSKSAGHYFGASGKILLGMIVFLACLSTAVGLITACSEYFERLLPIFNYPKWVILFTLLSFGFANFGLSSIIKFSVPVLMLLYPLTVAIIALVFLHKVFNGSRLVYICTIIGTLFIAVIDGWKTAHSMFGGAEDGLVMSLDATLKNTLPLYSAGLGWVLPAIAGFVVGFIISKVVKK